MLTPANENRDARHAPTASGSGEAPKIGQTMRIPGRLGTYTVRAVRPFGTCDVECAESGRWFRVSGLNWI